MGKGRLEAFSDGVLAIIITIMVLEIHAPHETSIAALGALLPKFVSYALSFVYVGIYWNNHHHLLTLVQRISGGVLWANLHLLFWLSLIPFATSWVGEREGAHLPVAAYGAVLLCSGLAYSVLVQSLISTHGRDSNLARAIGKDAKGIVSVLIYAVAIPLAFYFPALSYALYVAVALIWLIPDRRVERVLAQKP